MNSLRVLHVVQSLEPGGMENGVVNIARGLAASGIESDVACVERAGAFAERLPLTSRVVVLGKHDGFSPIAAWRLLGWVRRERPNIVHTHNLGPLIYTALGTLGGRLAPILHGEHSDLSQPDRSPRRIRQRRNLYHFCTAIHTVSARTRDDILELRLTSKPVHVIPNGVDTERFSPGERTAARAVLGVPDQARVIGIVGRFGQFKGHELLVDAFENLAMDQPNLHLLIVGGGGPRETAVKALVADSAARDRIHLTGFLPKPATAYRAMDLLLLPSTNEGMSNAALEAMACGVPVLANTNCGHEQIIAPETGFLRDLRSTETLLQALREVLATPERLVDFGEKALRKTAADFTLAHMLDSYTQIYRATASRRP